jgi:16S rRNA processing protein RimM
MALVKFRGYSDRARAEELIGGSLKIPRERLKPAGPDRYYIADLIGLSVETAEGRRIGVVRDVLQTGANDVYVVDVEGREVLVPAVDHVVKSIDLARGRLVIDLVDGLLD